MILRALRSDSHDDRGAVAVTVAVLLMVFILLAALVIDAGYWYNVRRQLQSAADAAALAGCWEVIKSGDQAAALNVARAYVAKNAVAPADGAVMIEPGEVNTATGHVYTEVTGDYVKVTVRKQAPAFFARVLGYDSEWIVAQSRADAQWLTGMKNVVPFALPFIDLPSKVAVAIGDGPEHTLTKGADGIWRATGIPVTVAANPSAYPLHITAYNKYGVPTTLVTKDKNDAAGVIVHESAAPFTDIWLNRYVVDSLSDTPSDPGIDIHVVSGERPKQASFDGKTYNQADFSGSSPNWVLHVPSPATDYLSESFPVSLQWGSGNGAYKVDPAAWVVARRSSFPIADASAGPHVVAAGGTIDVAVELIEYKYDTAYSLKVVASGGEVGNFCAIDLDSIYHYQSDGSSELSPEYDPASEDPNYKSPTYKHYLVYAFPFEIHLGDYLWTYPGAEPQPTSQGLLDRFEGDANLSYADWDAAGRPLTKRLVYVPLVEKTEVTTGRSELRVVAITSFYVEPAASYRDVIKGVFIEYVAGGQGSPDPPPTGLGILTPRLVSTDLDF